MKPVSDFTTPRRLIALISRHFFPVEQPEPSVCTTGLKNGSRFPFIAHFFSSGLGLESVLVAGAGAAGALTAGAADFATTGAAMDCCFGSGFEACATGFAADSFTAATFSAAGAAFAAAVGWAAGAGALGIGRA